MRTEPCWRCRKRWSLPAIRARGHPLAGAGPAGSPGGCGDRKSEVRSQNSELNDGALASDLRPLNSGRTLADAEREHIVNVVRETGWVLGGPKGAAARLGMKRSTLRWKMKRLGISRPQ